MKTQNIKNSAGKIIGETQFLEDKIIINNFTKPLLVIDDINIIDDISNNNKSKKIILKLYNNYFLGIGEIASLYGVCYSNINKLLKMYKEWKPNKQGRRNRAYGKKVSAEQSKKMSAALKGRKCTPYERTPEIRDKISKSLKEYFKNHPQNPEPHKKNWENGVYDNVDFKRGISGKFYSYKNQCIFRFRSLLELFFMIQLEENEEITSYSYENLKIKMDNGSTYMPDFIINDTIIELKSKKYVERVEGVKEKLEYKIQQAEKYCKLHNLKFKIIYDEDLNFTSQKMKHFINNNPHVVEKYKISFTDPKRMVNK